MLARGLIYTRIFYNWDLRRHGVIIHLDKLFNITNCVKTGRWCVWLYIKNSEGLIKTQTELMQVHQNQSKIGRQELNS